jgi:CheY-like chemotaxis protein
MDQRQKKMMVVCSDFHDDLQTHLVREGWNVIWVYDAKTAIAKAHRESFDLTVLISTGKEMDVTETLLNLRDVRGAMPIVVVTEAGDDKEDLASKEFLPLSNTIVLPLGGLDSFVTSLRETNVGDKMGSTRSSGS